MNFIIIEFEKGRMSTTGTGTVVESSAEAPSVCGIGVELTYAPFMYTCSELSFARGIPL